MKVKRKRIPALKKHMPILNLYSKANKDEAAQLVKYLPEDVIDLICECLHNALNNMQWDPDVMAGLSKKICKDKKSLRYLANAAPGKRRRKILQQSGGSVIETLLSILPIALAFI